MKTTTSRTKTPKNANAKKRSTLPSKGISSVALKDLSSKEKYVVISSAQFKKIIRQITDLRRLVEEALIHSAQEEQEPTKEEILDSIVQGLKEIKLHKEGKIKLKSAEELLNEL